MKIPFVDLKAQYSSISLEIEQAIHQVIAETAFVRGKFVEDFEENFARYCQARYCVGVGNGTDALFIALRALGIGKGDEVIVPANSFVATSEAVTLSGAKVVFADCDPKTYNININDIESKLSSKTKAIIPVHLYGQPADMERIRVIADRESLRIVQDCAQAHGAEIDGKSLSYFGDILCFSFYPSKNLGAYGDAGAIVLNDDKLADRIRMTANHGRVSKYDHEIEGVNSRLDGIQGAVLNIKLKYLSEWTQKRRENAAIYDQFLQDREDLVTPYVSRNVKHVYHLYVIRTKKREELQKKLKRNGIASGIHYPVALPYLKSYHYLGHSADDFPVAGQYQNEVLSLPMYPELSHELIEYISRTVMAAPAY